MWEQSKKLKLLLRILELFFFVSRRSYSSNLDYCSQQR